MSIQVPMSTQPVVDSDGIATTSWFMFFQGIYKAIRSSFNLKLKGMLNINTIPASNIGGGTDDLIVYTLPADTLINNGDILQIKGWGTFASNGNNKTVTINFGSQIIYTTAANAANGGTWNFTADIVRLSDSTQEINVVFLSNNTDLQNDSDYPTVQTNGTQDLTEDVIIKCTGAASSDGDITQNIQIINLTPND